MMLYVGEVCDSAMGQSVDTPFFTLELEHGGILCGSTNSMEYYNPTVEVIDYVDAGSFSYAFIEEHLKWLGYPVHEHIIYWPRPGKAISDGMVRIRGDEDVQQMIIESAKQKVLVIMVDHSDFIGNFRQDLIVSSFQSPDTLATSNVVVASATSSHSLISVNVECPLSEIAADFQSEDNLRSYGAQSEDTVLSDLDFSDSDYDIDDGDDDL